MNLNCMLDEFIECDSLTRKSELAKDFVEKIKSYDIVIYGAGATGMTLLRALQKHGLLPSLYIDRRYKECTEVEGIAMYGPEKLADVAPENTLIVMAINAEVIRKFNQEPFENIRKYAPDAEIIRTGIHMNSILRFERCCWAKSHNDFKDFSIVDCLDCGAEAKLCPLYQEYLREISIKRKEVKGTYSRKFDWFGYIVGQSCTLKCKDCCEHVPYLKNPVTSKLETILSDCRKIADSSEFLRYIELIGGEPFLHPQFKELLTGLLKIENVGYIKIFTNGTIVPDNELLDILENPRIVLTVSNYTHVVTGILLENIHRTIEKLKVRNIRYVYSESKEWTDWGGFEERGYSEEQVRHHFSSCFIANCHRVYQGILYRCPHYYAGIQRGLMPATEGEYVDINKWDHDELAQKLDDFKNLKFTEACKRCDMPFNCKVVSAGIQLEKGEY